MLGTWIQNVLKKEISETFNDIEGWRTYYFNLILFLSSIFVIISFVVTFTTWIELKKWGILFFDIGILLYFLVILLVRNQVVRWVMFFLLLYSMVVLFFISLGPFYVRPGWLVLCSVTAALLFGVPAAIASVLFNAVILLILYFFIGPHLRSWANVYTEPDMIWIIFVVNLSIVSILASLPVSLLLRRLRFSFLYEKNLHQKLVKESELQKETNAVLSNEIAERARAERELRESEERYRTIFESTATANIIVAEDTTILKANNNFARLVGYSRDELEGKASWTEFVVGEDLERIRNNQVKRSIDPGSVPSSYEIHANNRKGDVLDIFMSVAVIPETKESVASLIDLTEMKNLEKQLIQSQKMESIGRLAGGVAHDFNNMLSVIMGNTELAMARVDSSDPLYGNLQDIQNAGKRSADLTRQLLAFARKQTIEPKALDLNETVAGMLKMLQRLIGEDIELNWRPGHNLWKIRIDPSQVDQLLANLTVNARDAIEKAGRIDIATSNEICDEAYCADRPEFIPGEYAALAVSDNGCGMDKETLANIFEPFFTTKKEGHGTGLGLATVYGIVKQNNGYVYVYSEPDRGTTFRIYFPRHKDAGLDVSEEKIEMKLEGGTETVLIVEDEEAVLMLSKQMLEKLGYHVLVAGRAEEAIQLAGEYGASIDLLLTDVVMPDMNGKELSEKICSIKPGLKCLYMSGYTSDAITRQGILEEGVHYIPKPFSLRGLAAKIRETLGR